MNKLNPKEGRHLTSDLVECASLDKTLLEYIMDEYVHLIDDTKVEYLQQIINEEFGYD